MARTERPWPRDPEARDQVRELAAITAAAHGHFVRRDVGEYLERRADPLETRVNEATVALTAGEITLAEYLIGK